MTAFERHRIVIDGEEWSMTTDPLRDVLAAHGFHPVMRSTANFWGYSASWEVRDGGLHLTQLEGEQGVAVEPPSTAELAPGAEPVPFIERRTLVAEELFGHALPVLATWFSGTLHPQRGLVEYVHAAWESTFAEACRVVVERGLVVTLDPPHRQDLREPTMPTAPGSSPPARTWWQRLVGRGSG